MIGALACMSLSARGLRSYSMVGRWRLLVFRPALNISGHGDPEVALR